MWICTDTQVYMGIAMENEAAVFKVLADATLLRLMVLLSIQG